MAWKTPSASTTLLNEINARWPNRNKENDGTIGDKAHAARKSDHNPNADGVVLARDIDSRLDGTTVDAEELVQHIVALGRSGDPRLKGGYVINRGRKWSDKTNWEPAKYTGTNKHNEHIHVSLTSNPSGYNSKASWKLLSKPASKPTEPTKPVTSKTSYKIGDRGKAPYMLAAALNFAASQGMSVDAANAHNKTYLNLDVPNGAEIDFVFTLQMKVAVENFQRALKVLWLLGNKKGDEPIIDGIVGPYTKNALFYWLAAGMNSE